jgi:hypothetical protein
VRLLAFTFLSVALAACALQDFSAGGKGGGGSKGAGAADGGDGGAAVTGLNCGTEIETGIPLCVATSICPTVVIDGQAFPSCGFRIRGSVADLVCACGTQICPMGAYTTCAQAAQLLTSQTYASVCAQVNEGRCVDAPSPSGGGGGGAKPCDNECMRACGGGAACASLCNCP